MAERGLRLFLAVSLLTVGALSLEQAAPAAVAQAACSLGGTVFRDYDASGNRGPREPGVAGIAVTAFGADGNVIASAVTGAGGQYTLAGLPEGAEVRVEFTGLPAYLRSGPAGSQNNTSVAFVTCAPGAPALDFGVNNPGHYCQQNPNVATSCYVIGYQIGVTDTTMVAFPYTSGSGDFTPPPGARFDNPPYTQLAQANDIGSTWGLAYHRTSSTLFAAAFLKRHASLGPGGPGAIYAIDQDTAAISVFATLNAGADPQPSVPGAPWLIDAATFPLVGRVGLGGLSISDDGRTLWVVNLFDNTLNRVDVISVGGANPTAGAVTSFPVPVPGNCPAADVRPFALQFEDGLVYVGMVCSAESTQNPANLRAYVYSFDPATSAFTLRLEFPLNFQRGCTDDTQNPNCLTLYPASWNSWRSTFGGFTEPGAESQTAIVYPQPWLTDIEFDAGDMILGFRDRFGDQVGNLAFSTDPTQDNNRLYFVIPAGDILRACANGAGGWTLENNGTCGSVTTGGVFTPGQRAQGPGQGEYYFQEDLPGFHDETSMGSLYQLQGRPDVISTHMDPIRIPFSGDVLFDGGVRWDNNLTGQTTRAYRIFDGRLGAPPLFGKANGLGDLEGLCEPAPIEIGNRVWLDVNRNGVQDPGERPLAGVTVRLYDENGALIATTTTNANGEYIFNDNNVPGGLRFNARYTIRLDNPADYQSGGPLQDLQLTLPNIGGETRDSDGVLINSFPTVDLVVGDPGDNNHTYDFGFVEGGPPPQILTPTPIPGEPSQPSAPGAPGQPGIGGSFTKTVDPPFAQPGDIVTWTITAANTTSAALANTTVEDDIPAGFEILSVTASRGSATFSGQRVTVVVGALGPNETVTVAVRTRMLTDAPFIALNSARFGSLEAQAQVVRAGELVATGETPWWRWALLAAVGVLAIVASALIVRRFSRP
ncbi:MAG: SdrD B-like domain-containing protein [Aggregatilineales bacterium]